MTSIRDTIASTSNGYFMVAADHLPPCTCPPCLRFAFNDGLKCMAPEDLPANLDLDALVDAEDTPENRRKLITVANKYL